jgi:hypothetical protein
MRWDVVLNSPGSFTRVMTLLHREQTDVCQTFRDGFLKVAIVVVFSPGPIKAFVPLEAVVCNMIHHSVTETGAGTKWGGRPRQRTNKTLDLLDFNVIFSAIIQVS